MASCLLLSGGVEEEKKVQKGFDGDPKKAWHGMSRQPHHGGWCSQKKKSYDYASHDRWVMYNMYANMYMMYMYMYMYM